MNWLDILLLLILAWSVVVSFRNGLTREIVGLASVIVALLLGIWFYGTAGSFFAPYMSSRALANFAGFAVIFVGVMLAGAVVNFFLGKFWKVTGLSFVDHALGAAFGALRGILIAVALIMAIMAFSKGDAPPKSVVRSRLAPYVADAARITASLAPHELKDGFRKTHAAVKRAWEDAVKNGGASKAQKGNNEGKL